MILVFRGGPLDGMVHRIEEDREPPSFFAVPGFVGPHGEFGRFLYHAVQVLPDATIYAPDIGVRH